MENITESWQVILILIIGLVFGVVFWMWLRAGFKGGAKASLDPFEIGGQLWHAVINWRPVVSSNDGSRQGANGSSAGSAMPVPWQQNQAELELVRSIEDIRAFLTQHNLTDEQAIIILANMRRQSGDDLLSANKIRDVVGGADAVVKNQVAAQRQPKPKPKQPRSIYRPRNGWQP